MSISGLAVKIKFREVGQEIEFQELQFRVQDYGLRNSSAGHAKSSGLEGARAGGQAGRGWGEEEG